VLEIFSLNLIIGISDELPPDGDIKKVKLVSEIVGSFKVKQPIDSCISDKII